MPDLSIKQIKEVAKLIHEKESLELRIAAILGKDAPIKASPKLAAPPAPGQEAKPKAPPSNARQLQGKYMGKIRAFKGEERAYVEKLKAEEGIEAALNFMEKNMARKAETPAQGELPKLEEADYAGSEV